MTSTDEPESILIAEQSTSALKAPEGPDLQYLGYLPVVREALRQQPQDWTFKSDYAYQRVLEHVTVEQGWAYIDHVGKDFPALWQVSLPDMLRRLARANDEFGSPRRGDFGSLNLHCSPTNLRYLYHGLIALRVCSQYQHAAHFIELGAGYGGLALYIQQLAALFDHRVLSYHSVDLADVAALQQRYADAVGCNLKAVDGGSTSELEAVLRDTRDAPRFFVSAYAFSEVSAPFREWYTRTLVEYCHHGFIVWNRIPPYRFMDVDIMSEPERPQTSGDNSNMFVYF